MSPSKSSTPPRGAAAVIFCIGGVGAAAAAQPMPNTEKRPLFAISPVADGVIRLDTRNRPRCRPCSNTGNGLGPWPMRRPGRNVAALECGNSGRAWQAENEKLKAQLAETRTDRHRQDRRAAAKDGPSPEKPEPKVAEASGKIEIFPLPSGAATWTRMMSFLEQAWRRLGRGRWPTGCKGVTGKI